MEISRHSLIYGLSYALDIAGRNNLSHSKSTSYLAVLIGRELGMDGEGILWLYYTALLHDIALSNSYEMKQHCVDGERMLSGLPLPARVARNVYCHHEYYDGSGVLGLSGGNIPLEAQIISFSSAFDDKFGKHAGAFDRELFLKVQEWLDNVQPLFSDSIKTAFNRLIKKESFLLDYFNHETKYILSNKLVVNDNALYSSEDVEKFAHCFAGIIDCKSPFTFDHSHGIAELARKAAKGLGYGSEVQEQMYIAGLLHDIGKLSVSVDILHKPGKLTPEERFEINKHTYYTRKILEQIDGFENIVNYAANHHERLDGTGYPYRLPGESLSELERVMAICDVYQALTEERPYREQLPAEKVWSIIDGLVERNHLDGTLVEKVKEMFG
ncbi:MAG: HD domain-containing protein [Defluviitaleaceae bacterium]|nr:HD domain-containing protein [Defluviitaleaceae bacterium]MCL2836599.1 HD domain-containing protein [Defluviitaleaceae bacterium]